MQYGFGLNPCPLCIMARVVVLALFVLYLLACFTPIKKAFMVFFHAAGIVLVSIGIAITGRHLWILHLPPHKIPDCTPGLNYLMKNFPLNEAFMIMFKSSGECAGQHGAFLGITLPGWTLVGFCLYLFIIGWGIFSCKKKGSNATPLPRSLL